MTLANKYQRTTRTENASISTYKDTGNCEKFQKRKKSFRMGADALLCAPLLQIALARKSKQHGL
jgi:hypothetical protein